jgi:hypothetical protein
MIDVAAHAGTAFDGEHLFQIAGIASTRPIRTPAVCSPQSRRPAAVTRASRGPKGRSGWGSIEAARFHQIDPQTSAILRTVECNRVVTGATWIDGERWHGTCEGDESDSRRVDP